MNSNNKIAYILGLIGVIVLFVLLIDTSNNTKDTAYYSKYISYDWSKKFGVDNKNPLGLSIFNSLLEVHLSKKNKVQKIKDWDQYDSLVVNKKKSTYLFIGENCELLNEEIDTLLASVDGGSDLVMSFYDLSQNLYPKFFSNFNFQYDYADSIVLYAGKKELVLYNIYQNDTVAFEWEAFENIEVVDSVYTSLSSFMEMDNFIKIPHGKGHIYLHANPQFFYNYQVLRKDGFKQTNFFLNQIQKDQHVYWLELGDSGKNLGEGTSKNKTGTKDDDSYFKLLFKHPTLLFAMLLIILGFILFLLFRAKRLRPVVPYIEKKKNMTLSYADTITSIYFAKESPKGLLKVQRKNFYNTIHKHFFIDLTKRDGDKEIKVLAEKSNVPFDEINTFIELLENRKANEVTEKYITEVALTQRSFYDRTGIISTLIQKRIGKHERKYNRSLWLPSLLILSGIFIVLFGTTFLMNGKGLGIIFWPIGLLSIVVGILHLNKPLVLISQEKITFYFVFGKPKIFLLDELVSVKKLSMILFNFTQDRNIKMHYWLMSKFDKNQFIKHISNLHKLGQ